MELSQAGYNFLVVEEGIRYNWYDDGWGNLTIGIGHVDFTGTYYLPGGLTAPLTDATVQQLFNYDKPVYAGLITDAFGGRAFTQNEYDALFSFCFNTGDFGTTLRDAILANKHGAELKAAFELWANPPELLGRRDREYNLYDFADYGGGITPPPSTLFMRAQFSVNKIAWHERKQNADIWKRVSLDNGITWKNPCRIYTSPFIGLFLRR